MHLCFEAVCTTKLPRSKGMCLFDLQKWGFAVKKLGLFCVFLEKLISFVSFIFGYWPFPAKSHTSLLEVNFCPNHSTFKNSSFSDKPIKELISLFFTRSKNLKNKQLIWEGSFLLDKLRETADKN